VELGSDAAAPATPAKTLLAQVLQAPPPGSSPSVHGADVTTAGSSIPDARSQGGGQGAAEEAEKKFGQSWEAAI
jgi:hypothetical protein